jgi:hypothetical protein
MMVALEAIGGAGSANATVVKLAITMQEFASRVFICGDNNQPAAADKAELLPFQSHHQNHQVNDEQQHDGRFQNEHPTVGLVVLERLVKVVERLELAVLEKLAVMQH